MQGSCEADAFAGVSDDYGVVGALGVRFGVGLRLEAAEELVKGVARQVVHGEIEPDEEAVEGGEEEGEEWRG